MTVEALVFCRGLFGPAQLQGAPVGNSMQMLGFFEFFTETLTAFCK
jgi:hypothetical protein